MEKRAPAYYAKSPCSKLQNDGIMTVAQAEKLNN
jgi:hypothetical protein